MNVSNSTGEGSFNSVRRPKSKDTKSKNKVLKNTNAKRSSTYVRKTPSNVRIDSNKRETNNSNECHSNASVLNNKTVTVVNDGFNLVCVSCGKNVFLLSREKCVACYALSVDSRLKRDLFTSPVATQFRNLGATSVVAISRFSVVKTSTATNKTPKSKTTQSTPSVSQSSTNVRTKSKTSVTTQKLVAKLSILPSAFVSCDTGTIRFGNDHFAVITGYGDCVQGNLTICQNLEGDDLLTGSHESNLYTISIYELAASSPVFLMSKATSTKSLL
nr:hypothetical protein [Tanacetum cinerariifolium]